MSGRVARLGKTFTRFVRNWTCSCSLLFCCSGVTTIVFEFVDSSDSFGPDNPRARRPQKFPRKSSDIFRFVSFCFCLCRGRVRVTSQSTPTGVPIRQFVPFQVHAKKKKKKQKILHISAPSIRHTKTNSFKKQTNSRNHHPSGYHPIRIRCCRPLRSPRLF